MFLLPRSPEMVASARKKPALRWPLCLARAALSANRITLGLACLALAGVPPALQAQAVSPRVPSAETTPKNFGPADVAFVSGMIGHHAQALEMTALIVSRSTRPALRLLGERITVSQRDEIAMMSEWLRVRGEPVPEITATTSHGGHGAHRHAMPGMLSAEQMDTLRAARGARFDQFFLRYMIQHHEGALVMVRDLLAVDGAAREPQLYSFATDVDADQRAEIRRMQSFLESLAPTRAKR